MVETDFERMVDVTGRIVIPYKLREQFFIEPGQTYKYYVHEEDGEYYLCIKCNRIESEVERAKKVLIANGYHL